MVKTPEEPNEETPDTDEPKGNETSRAARAADNARRGANERADAERGGGVENQEV